MKYRTARVGRWRRREFEAIAALDDLCFPEDEALTWETFCASAWWLVRCAGKIVAFASAVEVEGTVILTRAGVHPEHRGRNLQHRLITHRVEWARARAAKQVLTYTVPNNAASGNNLIKAGFRLFKPDTWPTGEAVCSGSFNHWRLKLEDRRD